MSTGTRILLGDDHALVRSGLRLLLETEPGFEVVAEVGDGLAAVAAARSRPLDLAILDVAMPGLTGLQATREILGRNSSLPVVLLSMYDEPQYFFEALRLGASGYVLKSSADEDLIEAARAALRGEAFYYPRILEALMREHLAHPDSTPGRLLLSDREAEVLKLVAEGLSTREIAAALTLSARTVEHHRVNILQKLGMRDRTQLTRYAIRVGLIEP